VADPTLSVQEYLSGTRGGSVSVEDSVNEAIEKSKRIQKRYTPFITINEQAEAPKARGRLFGLAVSVKDNICTKGLQTTAGSKILGGYIPPFDATCIEMIKREGAFVVGKTAQDEFGFGTFSVNTVYSIPKNPFDTGRSCGGSSGGAGCLTAAADFPHVAIAESTGGSITAPAAFTGTVGLTPTYGRVSRYGLVDYSNSMDKIGVIGRSVYDCALMLSVISGYDPLDSTSSKTPQEDFTRLLNANPKGLKVGMPKEYFSEGVDRRISKAVRDKASKLEGLGVECREISLPSTAYAIPSYYLIAASEASTNLAKYCGLRYGLQEEISGNFDEYFTNVRTNGFGDEAKRRILLGTYARMAGFRDRYYFKALKVRAAIIREFRQAFKGLDALITPSMPVIPPKFSEIKNLTPLQNYYMDILTTAPNMAGMPTISMPAGLIEGLPVGMQIIADQFKEGNLMKVAGILEGLK
jgi:aspartyl-tRNA(Asn)/glutamyl-tRNA(Gln) amidotransferase subunit A